MSIDFGGWPTPAKDLCPDEEIPLGSRYMWVPHVSDQMPFTKKPFVGKEESEILLDLPAGRCKLTLCVPGSSSRK